MIEGVETSVQLAMLKERGCDQVQGYSFSRPLPGSEVKDLLAQSTDKSRFAATGGTPQEGIVGQWPAIARRRLPRG